MKSEFFICVTFFFVLLHYISCNKPPRSLSVKSNKDKDEFNNIKEKLNSINNSIKDKVLENFKEDIELLKKKVDYLEKRKCDNIVENMQQKDDDDEEEEDPDEDDEEQDEVEVKQKGIEDKQKESQDEQNEIEDEQKDIVGEESEEYSDNEEEEEDVGQNEENNDNEVNEVNELNEVSEENEDNGELDVPDDEFVEQSTNKNVRNSMIRNSYKDIKYPAQNSSTILENTPTKLSTQNTKSNQTSNQLITQIQGEESTSKVDNNKNNTNEVKCMHKLSDDVLTELKEKDNVNNNINHNKYNNFKKEFSNFTMNQNEYDLIKKLIITFSQKNVEMKRDSLKQIFLKALDDKKYREVFKNFMYGLCSYAKRHNYLDIEKMEKNEKAYKKVFENTLNLIDTI
ncbi:MSP7-like protein, putative [Plasmodium sp. gorilla clade G2]|uniref:MSP7-like protein, putative n=1 Tax=Plasmodium sp. gorilla clade G2 TaxID=880535 RepID=UPI000D29D94D|nr:MSP7-like protein, putative [Plasmodium sp. gorilla clade G2]SOV20114.1 MSP7-like protein, putative [Plasmodium sp. gorilla clade G2]